MLNRLLIPTTLVGLVLALVPVSAEHSLGDFHWARTSNPFSLDVGDNVSPVWDPFLDEAIADWSQSAVLDLVKVDGGTLPGLCRPTEGRIEVCSARYGLTGWIAFFRIWADGSHHITQAITRLNDTYFDTAPFNTPAWRRYVMCQEIAHDFGLDHQDEIVDNPNLGSCMDYTNDPNGPPSDEHPNAHDFEQLEIIYSHLDPFSTVGRTPRAAGPPAALSPGIDTPDQWGRLVRSSAAGRMQVFEQVYGRGHKVVTGVFWTDPDRGRHER